MMLAMLLLQAAAPADAPPAVSDWPALPRMPYAAAPAMAPAFDRFVADEVAAGRCPIARPADGHYVVRVDVATLIGPDGTIRHTVPLAINCPTVEQYGAGLVIGFARNNLAMPAGVATSQWYLATVVFDWNG